MVGRTQMFLCFQFKNKQNLEFPYLYQTGLGVDVNGHHVSFTGAYMFLPVKLTTAQTVSSRSLLENIVALYKKNHEMSGK